MNLEDQEAGARVEVNAEKRNPADFALWKLANPTHAMQWDSPWGRGFPGWHIECSAMSMKYLGQTFDIHCGGVDHIPIHHENEIAQSEGCTGVPFVRYWMHAEFLQINSGKMSKRAGALGETTQRDMGEGIEPLNAAVSGFLTVQSLVDQGIDPIAFRYLTLTAKYRAQLNYTDEAIQGAQTALNGLYDFVTRAMERGSAKESDSEWQQPYRERFLAAITDDLNVPAAVGNMHELISEANRRDDPASVLPILFDWDRVFGLRLRETAEARLSETLPAEIQALIDERQAARKERDFARADDIRAQLRELGYEIEDTPQGVRWKRVA